MKYMHKFFETKEEAKAFQRENGCGALYSAAKGSRTRDSYNVERAMACMDGMIIDAAKMPYVVAWNQPK